MEKDSSGPISPVASDDGLDKANSEGALLVAQDELLAEEAIQQLFEDEEALRNTPEQEQWDLLDALADDHGMSYIVRFAIMRVHPFSARDLALAEANRHAEEAIAREQQDAEDAAHEASLVEAACRAAEDELARSTALACYKSCGIEAAAKALARRHLVLEAASSSESDSLPLPQAGNIVQQENLKRNPGRSEFDPTKGMFHIHTVMSLFIDWCVVDLPSATRASLTRLLRDDLVSLSVLHGVATKGNKANLVDALLRLRTGQEETSTASSKNVRDPLDSEEAVPPPKRQRTQ
jgi:hypothetical protein